MHILSPETDNCPSWISGRERMTVENISWSISTKECCWPRRGLNPRPPGLQSDGASNWATEAGQSEVKISKSFQIKTQYAYVCRYPNWYTKLKSCPLMYITDWIPVYIVSARARRTAKYIIYVRSIYIVWSCLSSLLGSQSVSLFEWIWIFYFPVALDGTL